MPPGSDVGSGRARSLADLLLDGRGWNLLRLGLDLVLLYLAVGAALAGAEAAMVRTEGGAAVWVLPLVVVALLGLRGDYRSRIQVPILDGVAHVVGITSLATVSLLALDSLIDPELRPGGLLVRTWFFATLYLATGRVVLGLSRRRAYANGVLGRRTLIIGAGRIGAQVERRLETQPELGLRPVGYLDPDPVPPELVPGRRAPVLGEPGDLPVIAEETGARHVIFAFLSAPDHVLVPLVRECERRGLEMSLVPRLFDNVNARVELEHMGGLPLYGLRPVDPRGFEFAVKHVLGRTVAAALLALLSPVLLATAVAVKLTSRGPVLFRQRRIGRDGHEFELLKFRSMQASEESRETRWSGRGLQSTAAAGTELGPGGVEGSLRLTPIGAFIRRTALDELPQLWNVVTGDMTLVGPRPERPEFVEMFGQSVRRYDERHRVKSGITGWAQVHGLRGKTSIADRVEWDNYYIANWSLWLDFKILLMTLSTPFRRHE